MDSRKGPMGRWLCEHSSPVLVDEVEGGSKKIARCLVCGALGPPVRQGAQEALQALREQQPRDLRSA